MKNLILCLGTSLLTTMGYSQGIIAGDPNALKVVDPLGQVNPSVNLGVGTGQPGSNLHVVGTLQFEDGNQAIGKVLTSDANGVATWQNAAPGSTDNDWYIFGTTAPPSSIGDNIYKNGRMVLRPKSSILPAEGTFRIGSAEGGFGQIIDVQTNNLTTESAGMAIRYRAYNVQGSVVSTGLKSHFSAINGTNRGIGTQVICNGNAVSLASIDAETNSNSEHSYGLKMLVSSKGGHASEVSVKGTEATVHAYNGHTGTAFGGDFYAGFYGTSSSNVNEVTDVFGVRGKAVNAMNINYGGYFEATSAPGLAANQSIACYGVYGKATGAQMGQNGPNNYSVYADGDIVYTGNIYGTSDQKFKTNIKGLQSGLNIISQLRPVSYDFKNEDFPSINLPKGTSYGLIAQELKTVMPNLVKTAIHPEVTDEKGNVIHERLEYLSVNYTALIPHLIKAIQEQQEMIETLQGSARRMATVQTRQQDAQGELLNNVPNPFTELTRIEYHTQGVEDIAIYIYSLEGTMLKEYHNLETSGSIEVTAESLTPGMYYYSLFGNGAELATKKMVLTK